MIEEETVKPKTHRMVVEARSGAEMLLACPTCSRRVVLQRGRLVVLDRGQFAAVHSADTGVAVTLQPGVAP